MTASTINPDSLGPSPRIRMLTCDGSTTHDLESIGGGACRGVVLLSTVSGDLTVTPASPIDGSATEAVTVTNLPAGTTLPIQAMALLGPNTLKLLVLFCLALVLAGCTPTEKAVAKTSLDVANAVCTELPAQDEPEWVKLSCEAVGIADGGAHIFLARVKKPDAEALAARKPCPKCPSCGPGTVAP